MILSNIFGVNLNMWEEKLAATAYLCDIQIVPGILKVSEEDNVLKLLTELRALSSRIARELCTAVLLQDPVLSKQESLSSISSNLAIRGNDI